MPSVQKLLPRLTSNPKSHHLQRSLPLKDPPLFGFHVQEYRFQDHHRPSPHTLPSLPLMIKSPIPILERAPPKKNNPPAPGPCTCGTASRSLRPAFPAGLRGRAEIQPMSRRDRAMSRPSDQTTISFQWIGGFGLGCRIGLVVWWETPSSTRASHRRHPRVSQNRHRTPKNRWASRKTPFKEGPIG